MPTVSALFLSRKLEASRVAGTLSTTGKAAVNLSFAFYIGLS